MNPTKSRRNIRYSQNRRCQSKWILEIVSELPAALAKQQRGEYGGRKKKPEKPRCLLRLGLGNDQTGPSQTPTAAFHPTTTTALVRFIWLVTAPRRRRDEFPRSCTWIPRVIAALTLASRIRIRPRSNKTQRVPQLFWDSSLEIWPMSSSSSVTLGRRLSVVSDALQTCGFTEVDQKLLSIFREAHPSLMELQDQSWKGVSPTVISEYRILIEGTGWLASFSKSASRPSVSKTDYPLTLEPTLYGDAPPCPGPRQQFWSVASPFGNSFRSCDSPIMHISSVTTRESRISKLESTGKAKEEARSVPMRTPIEYIADLILSILRQVGQIHASKRAKHASFWRRRVNLSGYTLKDASYRQTSQFAYADILVEDEARTLLHLRQPSLQNILGCGATPKIAVLLPSARIIDDGVAVA
ncbi:hypothetical protein C8J57DRAFT_1485904 [Mycena rebaudengoi]|nr:hypothetical protein C8J57DRAFT_1485904 [Mycena rebaudengoi]